MKTYQKILSLTIIALAGLGAIFVFIVLPCVKKMQAITQQVYFVRKDLEARYERGQSIRKTADDLKKIEPVVSQLSLTYIKKEEELKFITLLEVLAQQNNLEQTINNLNFKEAGKAKITAVPLEIALSGDFANILKYISALEQIDYYVNIDNIILRPATEEAAQANISGKIYWLNNSPL